MTQPAGAKKSIEVPDKPAHSEAPSPVRIKSRDLLGELREVEIDHEGRIYRLRLTQLNKLILTA